MSVLQFLERGGVGGVMDGRMLANLLSFAFSQLGQHLSFSQFPAGEMRLQQKVLHAESKVE